MSTGRIHRHGAALDHRPSLAGREDQRIDAAPPDGRHGKKQYLSPGQETGLRVQRVALLAAELCQLSRTPAPSGDLPERAVADEDDAIVIPPGGTVEKVDVVGDRRH